MKNTVLAVALSVAVSAGYALTANDSRAQEFKVKLSGAEEVPPVTTSASGLATVTINTDMTVVVSVTTTGIAASAGHIHMAPAGQNGGVIVPFTRTGETWSTAPGAKLTEAQYAAFKAGNLYVNIHSKEHPGGEIRGQIRPYGISPDKDERVLIDRKGCYECSRRSV